jgi:cell wall-associated NlpC family hydrolase
MKSSLIATQAEKYLNKPFVLGDTSKGFDCISLIRDFFEAFGYQFPEEFEGITWKTYAAEYLRDPISVNGIRERFLKSLGQPIEKNYFRRGDLLLFRKDLEFFAGIDLGNGYMKALFLAGVHDVPFHLFQKWHIESRRLIG